jgi:hypothetical protein
MDISEDDIDRWLERGGKFFKTTARNPVVRAALRARGLSDEELEIGWKLYSELNGFGSESSARPATHETAAAHALNEIDAWDAPAYGAARVVLEARFPAVASYLFENLEASEGVAAVAGVERLLERIATLRDGKAQGVPPEAGRAAVDLLATRKILEPAREAELRSLIETVRRGAQPDEVVPAPEIDPRRVQVAQAYVTWINEWREVARVAIARRDYRISLGLAQRRQAANGAGADEVADTSAPGV